MNINTKTRTSNDGPGDALMVGALSSARTVQLFGRVAVLATHTCDTRGIIGV